jgi:glycerate 2-kinase
VTEADGKGVVEPARTRGGEAALRRPSIDNVDELCSHGMAALRAQALEIAGVGLAACDAGAATAEAVELTGAGVAIRGVEYPLDETARLVVLGSGKASVAIAAALERALAERLDAGLVIARRGEEVALDRIEVIGADHPLPSEGSVRAAERLIGVAGELGEGDLALACFTGGSSALASLPPDGVSVGEKRRLHQLLLGSGMPIVEVNAVRKHVSAIKGGRLATRIAPARIVNVTVSDVAGDVLDAVTDPTVQDTSTPAEAVAILRDYGLWDSVPESIRRHLSGPAAASPDLAGVDISTTLLVTGHSACEAMALEAAALGLDAVTISTSFEGEAREVGRFVANLARSSIADGAPFQAPSVLVACGGESNVTLASGSTFGAGGPSQEAAIAAALELDGVPAAAVLLDTDGSDGGTDAAGAVVDGSTVGRARAHGVDLRAALLSHRSREPLEALGDLVVSGPTGTNVNDLLVVVLAAGEADGG